jgi:hypothetical protein
MSGYQALVLQVECESRFETLDGHRDFFLLEIASCMHAGENVSDRIFALVCFLGALLSPNV